MLPLYPFQPHRLPWTCEFRLSLLRKPHIIQSMSLSSDCHLPARRENLQPILADRLQHHQAWLLAFLLGLLQQALVDKRSHCIQDWLHLIAKRAAHRLNGLERATTGKDREPPEKPLLLGIEEMVAPGNGIAEGLLPRGPIAFPTRQYSQPLAQTCEERLRWQQFDARCRQLDGQWQTIQMGTDFCDGEGIRIGYLEIRLDCLGS